MAKFKVWATVIGTKYIGEFEAETQDGAEKLAQYSEANHVSFCHACTGECEDPEIHSFTVEAA